MSGNFSGHVFEYDANNWGLLYIVDGVWNINLATSSKAAPHAWTNYVGNPVIVGANNRSAAAINDAGTYRILYDKTDGQVYYAYGANFGALTLHGVVFSGQGVGWEQFVRWPMLLKIEATYHMYYDGRQGSFDSGVGALGHATGADCINWTRDPANPLLSPVGIIGWEAGDVGQPWAALIGGQYYLFYSGYYYPDHAMNPHEIGYAALTDMSTPVRNAYNPVIERSMLAAEFALVHSPSVMVEADGTAHVYYVGKTTGNAYTIRYATKN